MSTYIGAGVLPVCYNPHADVQSWYFFLGQETYGADKDTWSDFGGRPSAGETPIATAAREGYEESRGALGRAQDIQSLLESDKTTCVHVPKRGGKDYFLYIFNCSPVKMECVSNDPYSTSSCACLACMFANRSNGEYRLSEKEKTSVGWVNVDSVYKAVMDRTQLIQMYDCSLRLRNAFCFALRQSPDYKRYEVFQRNFQVVDTMLSESSIGSKGF